MLKGQKQTEESRLKMSESAKRAWVSGKYANKKKSGFLKGHIAWNKGMDWQPSSAFEKGCISWNKGKHPEYVQGKNHPRWKGGKPICLFCKKILSTYKSKTCTECWLKQRLPTSIEIKVYKELKDRGFLFETQKMIGNKFIVDAYIPSLNLIVEADGDYWHNLPNNQRRDLSKDAYLKKCGYGVLRLRGSQIMSEDFEQRLEDILCRA